MIQSTDTKSEYTPKLGESCLYMTKGGVNWCACRVIAEYNGLIWIHNFYTGSHPVYAANRVIFQPMPVSEQGGAE